MAPEKSLPPGYNEEGISELFPQTHDRPQDMLHRTIAPMRFVSSLDELRVDTNHTGHRTEQGDPIWGLHEYVRGELANGTPFYIIDQHDLITGPTIEAVKEGRTEMGANLFIYDAHPDAKSAPVDIYLNVSRDYSGKLTQEEAIELAEQYIDSGDIERFNGVLQLLGFVGESFWAGKPATPSDAKTLQEIGTFSTEKINIMEKIKSFQVPNPKITRVEWDADFFRRIKTGEIAREKLITSPDMDAFAYLSPSEIEQEMNNLRDIMLRSSFVAIATSPGFIEQEHAIELTKQLLLPIM